MAGRLNLASTLFYSVFMAVSCPKETTATASMIPMSGNLKATTAVLDLATPNL